MKVEHYNAIMHRQMSRRKMLQGAASVGAMAAVSGALPKPVMADGHANLRAEILKIPGVGQGSPTDADWQKVGEMCLGPTKERVAEGEFEGVELTFMGLNNQNLHNFLFRGFLKPWEAYTGAKINWVDLAQADYNPRLQQAIATGTVDFDIIEMGAPFEGDTAGKGLLDEMPSWVEEQIEADDLVGYLQPPSEHTKPYLQHSLSSESPELPLEEPEAPFEEPLEPPLPLEDPLEEPESELLESEELPLEEPLEPPLPLEEPLEEPESELLLESLESEELPLEEPLEPPLPLEEPVLWCDSLNLNHHNCCSGSRC